MNETFWIDDHILSPLGDGTEVNFEKVLSGNSGVGLNTPPNWMNKIRPTAFLSEKPDFIRWDQKLTRLENLMAHSIKEVLSKNNVPINHKTLLIISSTKGNIDLLDDQKQHDFDTKIRATLSGLGIALKEYFQFQNTPIIVSNACISGGLALSVANDYLKSFKELDYILVCGADEISRFIYSGFESFQALSDTPCQPFDMNRKGLNLGEAVATVLLSKYKENASAKLVSFGNYNDANHISGPSRNGEGLFLSIQEAISKHQHPHEFDFISAHGTATPYNDEMESIAISRANLLNIFVHSLKGYFGHTLGASALIETILGVQSLNKKTLIPSNGFNVSGTSQNLKIAEVPMTIKGQRFLKLASGFGGCNIAYIIEKITR